MDVVYAMKYAELVRDQLVKADPANARTYEVNASTYLKTLATLNDPVQQTIDTIPSSSSAMSPTRTATEPSWIG